MKPKPVTSADIARIVSGRVTDDDELDRIMDAISKHSELEDLFCLLTGDEVEVSETDATDTEATQRALDRISLLRRARLCWLKGKLPDDPAVTEIRMPLHLRGTESSAVCSFTRTDDAASRWRLKVDLPANDVLLNLVAVEFNWNANGDVTRKRVSDGWNHHRAKFAKPGLQKEATAEARSSATSLAAEEKEGGSDTGLREHTGETFRVVEESDPRTARVTCLRPDAVYPAPVLLSGTLVSGERIHEARLVRTRQEVFSDLFPEFDGSIGWLEIQPLPLSTLFRLSPADVTELLSHQQFAIRALEPVPNGDGEFEVDLRDESMTRLLTCPNVSLCLSIADTEGEGQ